MSEFTPNIYYPLPITLRSGTGCWVSSVDRDDPLYLDCLAGYSAMSHGHRHPKILSAMMRQLQSLTLVSRAFNSEVVEEWEKLICSVFGAKMVIPMNTGAEAVETAIKVARQWGHKVKGVPDGQQKIIVCDGNFHGRTITIISFSTNDNFKKGFGPLTPGFITTLYGDHNAIYKILRDDPTVVAVLVEPLQGEGGMRVPPDRYLGELRHMCDFHNALLILDEVQTGMGRTGYLLAEEYSGIKADITCLGKALGGGVFPISAVLDRRGTIMNLLGPGDHGSTWGGNPLGCAVAMEAVRVLLDEELSTNSRLMGGFILSELKSMGLTVRGRGLMIGIVTPPKLSREFCLAMLQRHVLVKDSHGVVRVTPPLTITLKETTFFLEAVKDVLNRRPEFKFGGE